MGDNILRVERDANYRTINLHAVSEDRTLSAKATGLLVYLVTRPDGWKFYKSDIIKRFSDGRTSIQSGLAELREAGYLKMERFRSEGGTFSGWEWTVQEVPGDSPKTQNPNVGSSEVGKPAPNKEEETVEIEATQGDAIEQNGRSPAVRAVWKHYLTRYADRYSESRADRLQLDACGRLGHLRARLSEGYEVDELKAAIDGCFADPWHAERQKDELEYIIRNQGQVETFLKKYNQHGPYQAEESREERDRRLIRERDERLEQMGYQ